MNLCVVSFDLENVGAVCTLEFVFIYFFLAQIPVPSLSCGLVLAYFPLLSKLVSVTVHWITLLRPAV